MIDSSAALGTVQRMAIMVGRGRPAVVDGHVVSLSDADAAGCQVTVVVTCRGAEQAAGRVSALQVGDHVQVAGRLLALSHVAAGDCGDVQVLFDRVG